MACNHTLEGHGMVNTKLDMALLLVYKKVGHGMDHTLEGHGMAHTQVGHGIVARIVT
jgi:hypothetical protein